MLNYGWIGWILTIITMVITILIFRANRKVSRLHWWIESDQLLISAAVASGLEDAVAVTVGTAVLLKPRIVELRVANVGNVALLLSTMHDPLVVRVQGDGIDGRRLRTTKLPGARSAAWSEITARNLDQREQEKGFKMPDVLLNPGDQLSLQLLVDGEGGVIDIAGEAEGFAIVYAEPRDRARGLLALLLYLRSVFTVTIIAERQIDELPSLLQGRRSRRLQ